MGVPILWVQPARYGAEAYLGASACMDLDYAGRCEGERLHWCMMGAALEHDCAADGRVCGYQDDTIGYNCLDCARLGAARCDRGRWLSCDTGAITATDCAALGLICGAAGCEPPPISELDAGALEPGLDAGEPPAPVDAALGRPDAGLARPPGADAGGREDPPGSTDGCGCTVARQLPTRARVALGLAVGACALVGSRRRRRAARPRARV